MSVLLFPLLFLKCAIFICLFLIWTFFIFIKKTLIGFRGSLKKIFFFYEKDFFFLWKRFDFWSLELDTGNYLIEIWIFEIWDFGLKFDILKNWNLEFWKFVTWNFEQEIWSLKFLQLEILGILNVKIGHLECGILNLGMKILNWKFGIWDLKKTWNLNLKFYP